jgi:hypothetical protein
VCYTVKDKRQNEDNRDKEVQIKYRKKSRYSDSLRARRFRDRIPVRARFCGPFQADPETHSASCTMGTVLLSRGVKRPETGVNLQFPSSVEVKERVELYFYSTPGPLWPGLG